MQEGKFNNFRVSEVFNHNDGRIELRKRIPLAASPVEHEDLARRQSQEYEALMLVNTFCPEIVPEVYGYQAKDISAENQKYRYIAMELLDTDTNVEPAEIIDMIEQLQDKVPVPDSEQSTLPFYDPDTYADKLHQMMGYLRDQGLRKGMTDYEISKISKRTAASSSAIGTFSTVFVHTDVQKRHVGKSQPDSEGNRTTKIFDFDQAHFGVELEDFAFTSVRHPEMADIVKQHLSAKFKDQPDKLRNLDEAMNFFTDYFLVKGMYDRVHQSREKLFDTAARWYGRLALNSTLFRNAAERTGRALKGIRFKTADQPSI